MTRDELEKIVKFIDECYYYSHRQYALPNPESASYAANRPIEMRWSCPMRPDEISVRVENEFLSLVVDDEC